MTRGGVLGGYEEFITSVADLSQRNLIDVVGFWSHCARADEPHSRSEEHTSELQSH